MDVVKAFSRVGFWPRPIRTSCELEARDNFRHTARDGRLAATSPQRRGMPLTGEDRRDPGGRKVFQRGQMQTVAAEGKVAEPVLGPRIQQVWKRTSPSATRSPRKVHL